MSATLREESPIRDFLRSSFEDATDPRVIAQRKQLRTAMPVLIILILLVVGNTMVTLAIPLLFALVYLEEYLRARTGWPFLNCWGARIVVMASICCIPAGLLLARIGTIYLVILPGIVAGLFFYYRRYYHKWKLKSGKNDRLEGDGEAGG